MKLFAVRAVLIVLISVGLFFIADFFVAVPSLERIVMDQKKEMIRELTNSAWNILAKFENDERSGIMSRQEAQRQAVIQIQNLHYGIELKDYFWINDMHPNMVIHPYRSDLNGTDLTGFADPQGKHLFLEAVRVVKEQGAGYITYMWQWMDNPARIVPKISYVKGFGPWGWVIGTGVYIDDIQQEIQTARRNVIAVSSGILLLSTSLLLVFLYESLKTEKNRRKAEHALKLSEERYRMLVESAGECIFMGLGKDVLFANHSMLDLLGYSPEEFSRLDVADFVILTENENAAGGSYIRQLLQGESVPQRYETSLKARNGSIHDVTLSLSNISLQQQHGFIAIASETTPRRVREIEQDKIIMDLQSLVFFLDRPAGEICSRDYHVVSFDDLATSTAIIMKDRDLSVAVVRNSEGKISGLITREYLLQYLASCKNSESTLIGELTGDSSGTVSEKSPVYEAFIRMEQTHAPVQVIDHSGALVGVIREWDLLLLQQYSPTLLQREIEASGTAGDLIRINRRLPELIRILVRTGMRTAHVNQIITQNTRSIVRKALVFAYKKLGPAPCEFDFMVLGSEGRYEQTLRTDQDNALIYRDPPPGQAETTREYFQALGNEVCDILNDVGYTWCQGGIMAKNPEWNKPLSLWKETFARWMNALEAEDLLMARIFFDFRTGSGKGELVGQLQSYLDGILDDEPRFFYLLARNGLIYEPPVSRFGNFILSDAASERKGLDLKSAMTLIVDFARIYSLKHHIWHTNTRDRLNALSAKGVLTTESAGEIVQAYDYLMQIRIEHQVRSLDRHEEPDNFIDPESLTSIDQRMLKEVFNQIRHFQAKLSYDFTGTMQHG